MRNLHFVFLASTLLLCGCLTHEKQEVKIQLNPSGGEIWVKDYGWKSSDNDKEEIEKDFNALVENYEGNKLEKELSERGIYLQDKRIYLENEKIVTEYHGLFTEGSLDFILNFKEVNDEIIHILNAPEGVKAESNGKISKTEKNIIIAWPKSYKTLTWSYSDDNAIKNDNNLLKLFKK